jgi:hypothetical protein
VDALELASLRQLAQIASDRVFRQEKLLAQRLGDYLPIPPKDIENVLLSLRYQHDES